jgi:acyl-coenzyme A thioesterase PaaI-like protein
MSRSILKIYNYWSRLAWFGRWIFSWLVTFTAPYTGTLPLRVESLSTAKCVTVLYDWFWIRNPFKSIHAAALTNMGEATMGFVAIAWGEENKCRVIPIKLEVHFLRKARGTLKGVCTLPDMIKDEEQTAETSLTTDIYDKDGHLVSKVMGVWKVSRITESKKLK